MLPPFKNLFTILTAKFELLPVWQIFPRRKTLMNLFGAEAAQGQAHEALSKFSAQPQEAEDRAAAPIAPVQCWIARTALQWSVTRLARAAGLSWNSVAYFERGDTIKASTVEVIQRTLENAGIIFIDASDGGPGARLRKRR
jgi:DNA-binding Xre family transcriptional regulator